MSKGILKGDFKVKRRCPIEKMFCEDAGLHLCAVNDKPFSEIKVCPLIRRSA